MKNTSENTQLPSLVAFLANDFENTDTIVVSLLDYNQKQYIEKVHEAEKNRLVTCKLHEEFLYIERL